MMPSEPQRGSFFILLQVQNATVFIGLYTFIAVAVDKRLREVYSILVHSAIGTAPKEVILC